MERKVFRFAIGDSEPMTNNREADGYLANERMNDLANEIRALWQIADSLTR